MTVCYNSSMQELFTITARDPHTNARAGVVTTAHGTIETPIFMPVGTRATVKSLTPDEVYRHGAQIILGNTYHLYLQPGHDLIRQMGGLHRFMAWQHPILTDSGGFQVFSLVHGGIADEIKGRRPAHADTLPNMVKVTEDAVVFRSYLDGSRHTFTPERSIEIQHALGADIILCFDELHPSRAGYAYTAQSMARSHRWAHRCLTYHQQQQALLTDGGRDPATGVPQQALFGIVHGGVYADLRRESAEYIGSLAFDGICVGGALGDSKPQMYAVVDSAVRYLPDGKVRHLLGIGDIDDLFACVARGIDLFDCVSPTRLGRHGTALIRDRERKWRLHITNATLRADDQPIAADCPCYTCQTFSRAYLHHLFRAKELLGIRLVSLHNVAFLLDISRQIRAALQRGEFASLYRAWMGEDPPPRTTPDDTPRQQGVSAC